MARKKTETVVVTWRVKEALRRRLESAATHNEVSVNAEITRRIEESFNRESLVDLYGKVERLMGGIIGMLEFEKRQALKDPTHPLSEDELLDHFETRLEENRRTERKLLEGIKRMRDERGDARRTAADIEPELFQPPQQSKGGKP
jgi:hypothetical protein